MSVGSEPQEHEHTRLGISLSGGGIRSATFCLGVWQRLAEAGITERARYLSTVSGGSYLAAGLAISHALCPEDLQEDGPRPWARGSVEEAWLRRNLNYLAPGGTGRLWMVASVLYGVLLNIIPMVLVAVLCGQAAGVILGTLYPGLASRGHVVVTALPWVMTGELLCVVGALVVVGGRRFQDKERIRRRMRGSRGEGIVVWLSAVAAGIGFFTLVVPGCVEVLSNITAGRLAPGLGLGAGAFVVRRVLLGLVTIFIATLFGVVALWLLRRRRAPSFRAILAGLAGAGVLFAPFLVAADTTAVRGWSWSIDGPTWLGAGAVLAIFALVIHERRYSLHFLYRERLQEAFASRRTRRDGVVEVAPIPYDERVLLSDIARRNADRSATSGPPFPDLVLCAAVAARGSEVPSKTWAASFTFEGVRSGNRRLGLRTSTERFEAGDGIGGGDLTLPAIMAISGAAVSPLMGRFTLPAYRFLMAVLNIRLGVWIRNPARPERHPTSRPGWMRRIGRSIVSGWRAPGAWYVLKEGLGLVHTRGRYIFVSDGGHWENLGLTELLRRRCTHIVVVDASSDAGLGDLGRAVAVARAELNVEIRLDPRGTVPDEARLAETPVAVGTFRYPDGEVGDIFYARSVLWSEAPSDLHLFASHSRRFPNHPTSNQFLSGERFDAYRALGWAVGGELIKAMSLPHMRFDEPRMTWSDLLSARTQQG